MASRMRSVLVADEDSSSSESESGSAAGTSSSRGPPRAKIARSRVLNVNRGASTATAGAKGDLPSKTSEITKKSLYDRIKEFPGNHLCLRNGKLFCEACHEPVNSKKSIVRAHVRSTKHEKGVSVLAKSKTRSQSLQELLRKHDGHTHAVGEKLPMDVRTWRLEVVEGFLSAGIPLKKTDNVRIRQLLERHSYRLTSSPNLAQLIPVILQNEIHLTREELRRPGTSIDSTYKSREMSIIFDGSTRQGEAIAIVARYVDEDWEVKQRLLKLDIVARSVTGDDLAQVLNNCMTEYTIHGRHLLAVMRDGASVNGAAVARLRIFYPLMFEVVCMSHTIDNVGKHFNTPTLDEFSQWWISLFSHSCRAKLRWREQTSSSIRTYSETRWWSRWEVLEQICTHFGELEPFLENNQDLAPKTTDRLRAILDDPARKRDLQLELAAVVDVGQHFVRATYRLEGDGPLVFSAFRQLQEVLDACSVQHFPNVRAVAQRMADEGGEADAQELEQWAEACVRPGVLWFLHKFNVQLRGMLDAFRYVRYFCPDQVQALQPDAAAVEFLRLFPFLDDDATVEGLQEELPAYLAASHDCRQLSDSAKVAWWRDHEEELPCWSAAVKKLLLVQPSSAASERVFSLLKAAFGPEQHAALADYLQAAVMLQYNHRMSQGE